eukprot:4181008-Ditylum_brightwellii.AAC.1
MTLLREEYILVTFGVICSIPCGNGRWGNIMEVDMVYSCHKMIDMIERGYIHLATGGSAGD